MLLLVKTIDNPKLLVNLLPGSNLYFRHIKDFAHYIFCIHSEAVICFLQSHEEIENCLQKLNFQVFLAVKFILCGQQHEDILYILGKGL